MTTDYYNFMHDRITQAYERGDIDYEVYITCINNLNDNNKER